MGIIFYTCLGSIILIQTLLSVLDFKFRRVSFIYIIIAYPVSILGAYMIWGFGLNLLLGFFSLAIPLYITGTTMIAVKGKGKDNDRVYVGGADILYAPIYTVWFGLASIGPSMIIMMLYAIYQIPIFKKFMIKLGDNKPGAPLLCLAQFAFILCGLLMIM